MSYIQDKLDELLPIQIDILYNEDGQEIVKRQAIVNLFTDYHNHILEKIQTRQIKHIDSCFFMTGGMLKDCNCGAVGADNSVYNRALRDILSLLQDTNPKE